MFNQSRARVGPAQQETKTDAAAKARLRALRAEVDRINDRLLALLTERADVALEIGDVKSSLSLPGRDPGREEEMLDRLVRGGCAPFAVSEMRVIFRAIFDASLALQTRHGFSPVAQGAVNPGSRLATLPLRGVR